MGRQTRRVPLDFQWPMREIWHGYLMPEDVRSIPCEACERSGYNPATLAISKDFYDHDGFGSRWSYDYGTAPDGSPATRPPWRVRGTTRRWLHAITQDEVQALVDANRLHDLTHTWRAETGWERREDGYMPTAAEVNEWSLRGFGHDGINRSILIETRAKRLSVWGHCERCNGEGEVFRDEAHRAAHDAWEPFDPPTGEGFQMWETTSEGSPISPVFATAEELAEWLADNGASSFGSQTASREDWLAAIREESVVSMVYTPSTGMVSGVEYASAPEEA